MKKADRKIDEIVIHENDVILVVGKARFMFTSEMIRDYLAEGFGDDETTLHELDGEQLELGPNDFRCMFRLMYPFG